MYTVTVSESFVAQHVLTVPDPGPEGSVHSHHFSVSVRFGGDSLGEYGYLVDIDAAAAALSAVVEHYRDELLNDLPEFEGLNPSVEHFARLFGDRLLTHIDTGNVDELTVKLWEDDTAWAAHERQL
jgi:6-pyruvoyltetrahydropterin/6-carboxytetrahydropterin synthase